MSVKPLPFDLKQAEALTQEYGSPLYVYDEAGIIQTAKTIKAAFSWMPNYKNYFAMKATPTPAILKVLHRAGMGFDCSSYTELLFVQKLGIPGDDIFFTSNNTPAEEFRLAIDLGATVNIDDLTQVTVFINELGGDSLKRVAARYNPGKLKKGNDIIGTPLEAKYGMTLDQLVEAFKILSQQNITEFGLHTMVASNELHASYFKETAEILLDAVGVIEQETGVSISFINLGGGFGVNYKPTHEPLDVGKVARLIRDAYKASGKKLTIYTENGRYVTGPHGYLLTKVRYVMHKYKDFVGVDASMHNLMRPGMYGAYHHITVLGKESDQFVRTFDVVGSLCENNDKFAIDRNLPEISEGDLLAIHDVGAHGHAMGFNYNGMLRSAEILLHANGDAELIRRAETAEDYFATVVW